MVVQEVTHESWFGRIIESIKGVVIGLILFLVAFVLLFFNEWNYVDAMKALEKGSGQVVVVTDIDAAEPKNDGKPIHLSGEVTTEETLRDDSFGVALKAIRLKRLVEMYQWRENKKSESRNKVGGGKETITTYTYSKAWSSSLINSDNFKEKKDPKTKEVHYNPKRMPYEGKDYAAKVVTLGGFKLAEFQIKGFGEMQAYVPPAAEAAAGSAPSGMKRTGEGFYSASGDPAKPKVGDVRVSYKAALPAVATVWAVQDQESFKPFKVNDRDISQLRMGKHSKAEMSQAAASENKMLNWILRFGGFIMMFIGLAMIFNPLVVVADVVPLIGSIVGLGAGLAAFGIAGFLSLITIGIAWVFFRPMIGIPLMAAAAVILIGLIVMASNKKKGRVAAEG